MKLEAGKRYVTRDGHITGPLEEVPVSEQALFHRFTGSLDGGNALSWDDAGNYAVSCSAFDLLTEAPESVEDSNAPDMVNHPPHYKSPDGIECIDAIRAALTPEEFRGYCKGNAIKYSWREKHKGGDEDLKKAAWYLNKLTD